MRAMKQLTHRTCSSCEHWSHYKKQLDGVMAAECEKLLVQNKSLGMSRKVTKGGESCSQWETKQ